MKSVWLTLLLRPVLAACLLVCASLLCAAPTPEIIKLHQQATQIADTLHVLQQQAAAATTGSEMVGVIHLLETPMSAMVRMDKRVDAISFQEGNPDDKDNWKALLTQMREIGLALEAITTEIGRFEDDEAVERAFYSLEHKLSITYIEEE
ncbi:MAG: hypothetical protein K8R90_02360 [Candidatus Cloacimonetes bacterium]|nr:hypothetical protein [Candidatus Cloacimonadota bacterium]